MRTLRSMLSKHLRRVRDWLQVCPINTDQQSIFDKSYMPEELAKLLGV